MKSLEEIRKIKGLLAPAIGEDGGMAYLMGLDQKKPTRKAVVVWSTGGGWDHVSVSFERRCPSWDEMVRVKEMFFKPDEWAIQYNPPKSLNISFFDTCLHLWRPQDQQLPIPPYWMVGPKEGQTAAELAQDIRESGPDV